MSLQTPSLDIVSPGARIVKKPFRKPLVQIFSKVSIF